ncbi:MAG: O-antigen ligase family protein [Planctomycetota bacterium]
MSISPAPTAPALNSKCQWPPPAAGRRIAPIIGLSIMSAIIGVWCIVTRNLSHGDDAQTRPLVFCALLLSFFTLFDLRVGLAVLLLAIGLSPEIALFGVKNFRYEDLFFPLLFLIWLSRQVIHKRPLATTDLRTPIMIILFLAVISSLSNHLYSELNMKSSLLRLGKSVMYYFILIVVLNSLKNLRDCKAFVFFMLLASSFVGLYGLLQYSYEGGHQNYRLGGPPGETANTLGGYFVFHMCLALGLLTKAKPALRLPVLLYLGLMALPFTMTLSRTSYVALGFGLVVIWSIARSRTLGWALVMLALSALLIPESVSERLYSIFDVMLGRENSSWDSRVSGWGWFIPNALDYPLLGRGMGSRSLGQIDSEYVLVLNDIGVIGLGAFLLLITRCMKKAYKLSSVADQDPVLAGFTVGYFGGGAALLVHSIAATTFTTIRTTEPFFFATGILYAYWNILGAQKHRGTVTDEKDAEVNRYGRPMQRAAPRPSHTAETEPELVLKT